MYVFMNLAAEFPKTPSPKPARIPPQTPPAGGTRAEARRIHIPSQMFRPAESALVFRVLRKMGSDFLKQTPHNGTFDFGLFRGGGWEGV